MKFVSALVTGLASLALGLFAKPNAPVYREVVRGQDHFEFTYRMKLPTLSGPAQLWLPLARSDAFQTVRVKTISAPIPYERTADRDYGNQILVLAPSPADSGKIIEIQYAVRRREKAAYPASEQDVMRHLRPERLVPLNHTFKTIADDVTRGAATALQKGRALYDHTLARMKYDKSGQGWGRGDAVFACDVRTGNCTDFHAYFIALARAAGLPARFAIGYTIPADRDDGAVAGYHCWAEFHADGKWIPVDISEASKHPGLTDYYFGHHPANRFELTAGRDLVITPAPATHPINFLVYPLLEVGGQPVNTENQFTFRRLKPDAPSANP
jgi:transglutaminase-like putative cysteine protease